MMLIFDQYWLDKHEKPCCPFFKTPCLGHACAMFLIDVEGVPEDSSSPIPIRGHCGLINNTMEEEA